MIREFSQKPRMDPVHGKTPCETGEKNLEV